jgi:alpha-tubulin suppressor-like RCC1 family protein
VFTQVPLPRPVVSIACGENHVAVIDVDGGLWVAGSNASGQLGWSAADRYEQTWFVKVPGLPPVVAVSCGSVHTLVACADGSLWGAGENLFGQLGCSVDEPTADSFVRIGLGTKVASVSCANGYSLVVTEAGDVLAAGALPSGPPEPPDRFRFAPLGVSSKDVTVASAKDTVIVACADGVFATGDNEYGQLGLGHYRVVGGGFVPLLASLPSDLLAVFASDRGVDPELVSGLAPSWDGTLGELLDAVSSIEAAPA